MEFSLFNRISARSSIANASVHPGIVFLVPVALILITLIAYWPGLGGIFILDDYHVLERINDYGGITNSQSLMHYVFNDKSGVTGRPISMLSFLIDDQYWPGNPASYKQTNLLLHVLCGLLLFLFFYQLLQTLKLSQTSSLLVATLAAAIWLIHPLNVSTTLYVVQRMTLIMSTFTVAGMIFYLRGRLLTGTDLKRALMYLSLSLFPFGVLSFLSKENGILILFYILTLEFTLFNAFPRPKLYKIWLVVAIGLPVTILLGYFIVKWGTLASGFHLREFTQYERVLTETRILVTYISYILLPRASGTGLFHDDFTISSGLFSPTTTILSIILILFTLACAVLLRKNQPVISFAILWFFSGHLLESTFLNLELYFEHRNYLPMAGIIFAMSYYLFILLNNRANKSVQKSFYVIAPVLLLIVFSQTYKLSNVWSKPDFMFPVWAEEHPNSLRAQKMFAKYLALNGKQEQAIETLETVSNQFPQDVTTKLQSVILACNYNIPGKITLQSLIDNLSNIQYSDGILQGVTELINLHFQKQCANFTLDDLHKLINELTKVPSIAGRSVVMSRLYYLHANIYVKEGNLSQTMALLDKANRQSPGVSIPLYQAWLLGSAGLYKDAIEYLDMAEKADARRKFLAPSRMKEISTLKQQYFQKLR